MKSNSGLSKEATTSMGKRLAALLADIHQLYIKALAYHWNVEGPRFSMLHKLFEESYTQLASHMDEVAERIRKLGELAPGSLELIISLRRLKDAAATQDGDEMIEALAKDYEALLVWLRDDISWAEQHKDPGSADLLTGILRQYEKKAWMLRSHQKN